MTLFQQLFNQYNEYHVAEISTNRFSPENFHQVLAPLIDQYRVETLGNSVENRIIKSITIGKGPTKVLLWSQMHGNESTASRAILDVLQFFNSPNSFADSRQSILEKLTICVVPMVNPDGAARFERRNALGIDLNRDARFFVAPEAQILKAIIHSFKPDFAFNLHDQRRIYNVENTGSTSTIAFLAPAYNDKEEINDSRAKAMQLIAYLRQSLEKVIPGHVGLYNDTYSPRAFGDYCQSTGASTVLIESGWEHNDMEKEYVRKLNFCLLVSSMVAIANKEFLQHTVIEYQSIPMNDEKLFDLLIRNVSIKKGEYFYKIDVGIDREEILIAGTTRYNTKSMIADMGDLKGWYGYEVLDARSLIVSPGLVASAEHIHKKPEDLLRKGYLYMKAKDDPLRGMFKDTLLATVPDDFVPDFTLSFEGQANFLLRNSSNEIKFMVINGFLWNLADNLPAALNGLNL